MTEYEKMKKEVPFNPVDKELIGIRTRSRELELIYNGTQRYEMSKREEILNELLDEFGEGSMMLPNIHFDYGCNTKIGKGVFSNVNLTVLDVAPVEIGDYVLIGPNVTLCTPTHPLVPDERMPMTAEDGTEYSLEYAKKIVIGTRVWIGAGVIINPGVHIGDGAVIGSGSVVTKDIPPGVIAAGVPCRVIRNITEADRLAVRGY